MRNCDTKMCFHWNLTILKSFSAAIAPFKGAVYIWTSEHLSTSSCCISLSPLSDLFPPTGGLSAGQPYSQLPGAAVRPPPPAPPVGGHLPGSHLAELRPSPLVWSSRQRPWEALHPAVGSHSRGERLIPGFGSIWFSMWGCFWSFFCPAWRKYLGILGLHTRPAD